MIIQNRRTHLSTLASLVLLAACKDDYPSPGPRLVTAPALRPKSANGTVPRTISLGSSSASLPDAFYRRAVPLGLAEHALIYPTVGQIDALPHKDFEPQTDIILALKFFPKKGCGAGPDKIPPPRTKECPGVLREIIDGRFDFDLFTLAQMILEDGRGVTIRPLYEVNGDWYPWQAYYPANDAADVIPAFQQIVSILRNVARDLVAFEFGVNWEGAHRKSLASNFALLYPGNDYVDRVVITGYNRCGSAPHFDRVRPFVEFFRPAYQAVVANIDERIPIGVGETNTSSLTTPPACIIDRIAWFEDMFQALEEEFLRVDRVTVFLENVAAGKVGNDVPIDWGINDPHEVRRFREVADRFRQELNATYKGNEPLVPQG